MCALHVMKARSENSEGAKDDGAWHVGKQRVCGGQQREKNEGIVKPILVDGSSVPDQGAPPSPAPPQSTAYRRQIGPQHVPQRVKSLLMSCASHQNNETYSSS